MATFAIEYKRLLGTVLFLTVVLGPTLAILTDVNALIGVVYVVGFFIVTPAITWLGSDLPIVRDRNGDGARNLGREFETGRSRAGNSGE